MTMTWQNGRQLTTLSQGDNNISYSYDSNSIRVSKTVNGVKYTYAYVNGLLVYETRGNSRFYYSYDANGTLYSVKYMLESAPNTLITYYYTHNSRGDIVGIYNGDGVQRVKYEYDAWENLGGYEKNLILKFLKTHDIYIQKQLLMKLRIPIIMKL